MLLRKKYWEQDLQNIDYPLHIARTVCYPLGHSAMDTLKEWRENGRRDWIEDEMYGFVSEERQAELARLNLNELLDVLFFQNRSASTLQVFPENRTQAMTDLEVVVVKLLENTSKDRKEIKARKQKRLREVYSGEKGLYLPSQHRFKKHGKEFTADINVDLDGTEVGKFFFAVDHPGSGSPVVYFDHHVIYNNAPDGANVYVIGGMKHIRMGKELEQNPSSRGRQTRRFIWSPICADTKIAPIYLQDHTEKYEGFCVVPVKYLSVDDAVLQEVRKE